MKVKQRKRLNVKSSETRSKTVNASPSKYKQKRKSVPDKKKSIKCFAMNSSQSTNTLSATDSALREQLLPLATKRKKKKETHSAGTLSSESPQEHRNLGSPVIVEALSENFSSLRIPRVFRERQRPKSQKAAKAVARSCDGTLENGDVTIVVAQSINPNDSPPVETDGEVRESTESEKDDLVEKTYNETLESNVSRTSFTMEEDAPFDTTVNTTMGNDSTLPIEDATPTSNRVKAFPKNDLKSPEFYCLKNKVVVIMKEDSRFCFTGKMVVKVIYGAVEIYGCVITSKSDPTEVYSPRGYSSVAISTDASALEHSETDVWASLSAEGVDRDRENKLVADADQLEPGMAVMVLSGLENKLTKFLNVFYPFRLFPKINNIPYCSWTDPRRAEVILQSNLYFNSAYCKELAIDRNVVLGISDFALHQRSLNGRSSVLIAGGKGVGKSTMVRHVVNAMLPVSRMVVLVDLDPGQAECTPPGCISYTVIDQPLMGPNFTHLKMPSYQLYIGEVNISRCLTRYIEGLKMLVDKLSSCPVLSHLPIVVNTMGFTQDIGWDIMVLTIKLIRPDLVVQIRGRKAKSNFPNMLSTQVINQQRPAWSTLSTNVVNWSQKCEHDLFTVDSNAEKKVAPRNELWNMEPYQQRELVQVSYFSELLPCPGNSPYYDATLFNIADALPLVAPLSTLVISIPRTFAPPSHALSVINGNIVALCGIDLTNEELQETEASPGPRVLTRSSLCACYGFGIVRGVDMEKEEVYIITPLPASTMQYVNYLVGCIPVPLSLLQLNQQKIVPYTGGNTSVPTSKQPRRVHHRLNI